MTVSWADKGEKRARVDKKMEIRMGGIPQGFRGLKEEVFLKSLTLNVN
jgi:hypothetical protein